jgi:sugar phosphate permease
MLTKPQGGVISTAYFFAYGAGQILTGAAADRTRPQNQILLGCFGAAAMNLMLPFFCSNFPVMLAIWTANGIFQSMMWPPTLLLVAASIPKQLRGTQMWLLNTSPAIGSVLSYLFSSALLLHFSWGSLFTGAGIAMAAAGFVFFAMSRKAYEGGEEILPADASTGRAKGSAGKDAPRFVPLLLASGAGLLIVPVMIHGMLKDGTTNWIPTYMNEVFSLSADFAVALAVVPQVANLLAASAAYWLKKHTKQELEEVVILFSAAGASLFIMLTLGRFSSVLTIVMFAITTMSMQAVNVVVVTLMPTHFARYGRMATVSGLFNSIAYIGCAFSTYGIAVLSQNFGWNVTIVLWLVCACVSIAFSLCAFPKWKSFLKQLSQKDAA